MHKKTFFDPEHNLLLCMPDPNRRRRILNNHVAPETQTRLTEINQEPFRGPEPSQSEVTPQVDSADLTETELFHLYAKIAQARPGTRDAEIFEKIHEWSFSDFARPAHDFAGITKAELTAWQTRHRINLSSGHIRPAHIDLARGHAWGTTRRNDHANGRHTQYGPPSREELLEMMGAAR
jgi:hypothetical protein